MGASEAPASQVWQESHVRAATGMRHGRGGEAGRQREGKKTMLHMPREKETKRYRGYHCGTAA